MKVLTPDKIEIPISEVAELSYGKSYTEIRRVDRNRTVNIRAEVDANVVEDVRILREEAAAEVDKILKGYQGIGWSYQGEAREESESNDVLFWGTMFVLFIIYAMLAIPFRSWSQPFVVMLIIPFGLLGAIFGHLIMDIGMSMMSYLGMLALTGVVVNDSLVLVDYVNQKRAEGGSVHDAVWTGGVARFRPILLTSLTTFFGLVPLIFEKSSQAQFLIPMAVSLGFGIMFATFVTLVLVPTSYLIFEDVGRAMQKFGNIRIGGKEKDSSAEGGAPAE
jgi:multidrug efflux pump subunit AcrB